MIGGGRGLLEEGEGGDRHEEGEGDAVPHAECPSGLFATERQVGQASCALQYIRTSTIAADSCSPRGCGILSGDPAPPLKMSGIFYRYGDQLEKSACLPEVVHLFYGLCSLIEPGTP